MRYYQTTPVSIDLENDTDAVVITAYATSIFNGELAIWRKLQCKGPLPKIMSKITVPLNVTTLCDLTSRFSGFDKKAVSKRVQDCTETRMFLTQLSHDSLDKFVIKHI